MAASDIGKSAETQPVQHQQSNAVANKRIAVRIGDGPRVGALFDQTSLTFLRVTAWNICGLVRQA